MTCSGYVENLEWNDTFPVGFDLQYESGLIYIIVSLLLALTTFRGEVKSDVDEIEQL